MNTEPTAVVGTEAFCIWDYCAEKHVGPHVHSKHGHITTHAEGRCDRGIHPEARATADAALRRFVTAAALQLHDVNGHIRNERNAPKTEPFDWTTNCQHPDCVLARSFAATTAAEARPEPHGASRDAVPDPRDALCPSCSHPRSWHSSGGMCDGHGMSCHCVRFPDSPDEPATPADAKRVLDPDGKYSGLIDLADRAKADRVPMHVATRSTCAEHIERGDDKATVALGPERVLDLDSEDAVERLAEAITASVEGWVLMDVEIEPAARRILGALRNQERRPPPPPDVADRPPRPPRPPRDRSVESPHEHAPFQTDERVLCRVCWRELD